MTSILSKRRLSDEVYRLEVEAPLVSRERRAGQFVIVQADEDFGERIPLTIADADPARGSIVLVFQTVGASTHALAAKGVGDPITLLGPLGNPTHIEKFGKAVCVGGGIGLAPLHPIVAALKAAGNEVTVIVGARTAELLVMQEELASLADELIVVTDDGSAGRKARVTEPLKELCAANFRSRSGEAGHRRGHRAADHDEILRRGHEALRCQDARLAQYHHDRRHRDVRRLPRLGGRRDQVRLRGRPRVRRPSRGLGRNDVAPAIVQGARGGGAS